MSVRAYTALGLGLGFQIKGLGLGSQISRQIFLKGGGGVEGLLRDIKKIRV